MKFRLLRLTEILRRFEDGELLYCKKVDYSGKDIENNSHQFCAIYTPDYKTICLTKVDSINEWEMLDNLSLDRLLNNDWYIEEEEE